METQWNAVTDGKDDGTSQPKRLRENTSWFDWYSPCVIDADFGELRALWFR